MAINRAIEVEIEFNRDNPEAVKDLKALRRLYTGLLESGRIRTFTEDGQSEIYSANLPLAAFEKSLRFTLQHIHQPIEIVQGGLLNFPQIRQRLPDIDQLGTTGD